MFIKTENGSILNMAHFCMFGIPEKETGAYIEAVAAVMLDNKSDRMLYNKRILTCDNKDEAQKALDSICQFIEFGENLWDAERYKTDRLYASSKTLI